MTAAVLAEAVVRAAFEPIGLAEIVSGPAATSNVDRSAAPGSTTAGAWMRSDSHFAALGSL